MLSHQQICNHGGSQRAGIVAAGGLLGLSLHHCGCSVQASSAVLSEQCRFLPEMVLYRSVLGKIIPEALSCPHFLLCFCFIFSVSCPWCSGRGRQRKFDYCNSCSQSLLVTQLLAYRTAALHGWNVQMCSYKLLCMSSPQHCSVKYLNLKIMLFYVLSFPSAPSENRKAHQICERLRRCSGFWCPGVLCSEVWLAFSGCPVMFQESSSTLQQRLWSTQLRNFYGENNSSPFCSPCMKTYWTIHLNVAFKHWLHQNEVLGILTCFEVYFPA